MLAVGEIYAGLAADPHGKSVHHVILLPGTAEKNWADAKRLGRPRGRKDRY